MPTLIVITGPTGVGKTAAAIQVAQHLGCDIINADSRQVFRGLSIGTSAAQFETDVMALLPALWQQSDYAVMCGGSMMYVDAVCRGIDPIPDISDEVRTAVKRQWQEQGLEPLLEELKCLDPTYYEQVDKLNPKRVVHAVEICRQAGVPYSSLRTGQAKQRPFNIIKIGLNMEREKLFDRINRRVDAMIEQGLEAEARSVYHLRHLNSLNTVGYKEMFAFFDGTMDRHTAIERLKKNTRVYAKKQLTWFKRDTAITWCEPSQCLDTAIHLLSQLNCSSSR